jgi:hypothetical protein
MRVACPFLYVAEKVLSSIGMASRVLPFRKRVECGILRDREELAGKLVDDVPLVDACIVSEYT